MSNPTAFVEPQPTISRKTILHELDRYARPSNLRGSLLAVREYLLYWGAISVILFAPWMSLKLAASLFAGFRLSSSYTIAHDAAHRALVKDRRLNWVIAMLLGVPSCQNYRMWVADHNGGHHPKTNGESVDFYRPLSKQEFDRLSLPAQYLERFIRAPNVFGFGFNFMFRWLLPLRIHPTSATLDRNRAKGWTYFGLMMTYHAALVTFLVLIAPLTNLSTGGAVLLGWFLPLCVHCEMSGASLYLMHNNRRIPWFREGQDRTGFPPERCSTHLVLPKLVSKLVNNVYSHAAHHAHPGIPCYHLYEAQLHLNRLVGNRAVVEQMSLRNIIATMRACKLYDYERHQWLDFDGKPTTPQIKPEASSI
ncbi:fatty acid desaturase family protein [Noviherbaspirillum suwonense]|uniref:Omega-6 fatty acid desaturase (Delta-12 desaturase) n=1 Tax=Noviherbaspirillum suwonense TaxID=1224511 RepID=A0ABY1QNW9_9BURK|nr:fatty acid desaturase [Noviherbaspirillum suwonense]SMP75010.1 omega-6 fatty acid desaturase (delta-12 desaturase) [Noviherbaspirillum suwonense]